MDENEMLDVFDFNLDIDFETAYAMISNDDDDAVNVTHEKDQRHKEQHYLIEQEQKFLTDEHITPSRVVQGDEHEHEHEHETFHHDIISDMGTMSRTGLLSAFESHAIESFLDSLISPGGGTGKPDPGHLGDLNFSELDASTVVSLEHEVHGSSIDPTKAGKFLSGTNQEIENSISGSVKITNIATDSADYRPEPLTFPDIAISDSEIPSELVDQPTKLKKWKHVALEKKRRDVIKNGFDNLVDLIRFPRLEASLVNKLQGAHEDNSAPPSKRIKLDKVANKRIPKHVLLNYIIEDIGLLILANRELESKIAVLDEGADVLHS